MIIFSLFKYFQKQKLHIFDKLNLFDKILLVQHFGNLFYEFFFIIIVVMTITEINLFLIALACKSIKLYDYKNKTKLSMLNVIFEN